MPTLMQAPSAAAGDRLLSLDVLRGLTIAGMILVNSAGLPAYTYRQLTHAAWNDPTATDVVFPCFLVMVGVAMTLSFAARLGRAATRGQLLGHALRRSVLLVALGLLVNSFWILIQGTWRVPGILQRIGICYLFASLLYLALSGPATSVRARCLVLAASSFGLLAVYWGLLKHYPTPGVGPGRLDPYGNVAAVLDRAVLTPARMFRYGVPGPGGAISFDPEGILSTLGALAAVLFGALAGEELRSDHTRAQQCGRLALGGTALWLGGLALRPMMPLVKNIYTPSFALWSTGMSLVIFAGLFWLIDVRRVRRGWTLALILGSNAIFAFCVSQVLMGLIPKASFPGQSKAAYEVLADRMFATWLPPRPASLAWALLIVVLNAAIVYPLYRKRLFLRL